MKFRVALAALGTAGLVVLTGCGNGPPPDQSGSGSGGGGGGGGVALVPSGPGSTTITTSDANQFAPKAASVATGATVEFKNGGNVGHNVTFDAGAKSDTFSGGDSVYFKFSAAGSYHYQCTIHPGMEGTLTVQ